MSKDPTMDLIHAFDDPTAWGDIKDNVPIFIEHRAYERGEGKDKEFRVVQWDEPAPPASEGWKLAYEVGRKELQETCEQINKTLNENATPMLLNLGHRMPGQPQTAQPELAGYGVGARMGTFGKKKKLAILTKGYFRKGYKDVPAEYPHRSPEFKPATKLITAVAMLKTDPRLPMGTLAYAEPETVHYGMGFMAEENKLPEKPEEKPAEPVAAKPAETPAPPAAQAAPALAPLSPEEAHNAARLAAHFEQHHPMWKYACEQYRKYAASAAGMAAASPTNGTTPATPIGAEKPAQHEPPKKEDSEDYMDDEIKVQYEARIAALEQDRLSLRADQDIDKLRKKVKIRDAKAFKARLVSTKDQVAYEEVLADAAANYAPVEKAPVGRNFLPITREEETQQEVPTEDGKNYGLNLEDVEVVNEIVKYGETNKMHPETEDGFEKSMEAYAAAQKKKRTA